MVNLKFEEMFRYILHGYKLIFALFFLKFKCFVYHFKSNCFGFDEGLELLETIHFFLFNIIFLFIEFFMK